MKDAFDQWWNGPISHSPTWRPYRLKYTKPSWPCRPRIATTAPRSTRPCGAIKATGAQVERGQIFRIVR